jgi:hypothetical protein
MAWLPVGARQLIRRRFAAGTWDSTGRYVNGAATDTTFWGSYQPINTNLQRERGGERRKATHVLSSTIALQVSLPEGGPLADRIVVPSTNGTPDYGVFEVESVQPADAWSPIPHYEADIYRYNEPDPADPNQAVTVAEIILQTCRAMAKAACTLTDAQVVVQLDKAPRPPLPYLAMLVDTMDQQEGAFDSAAQTMSDLVTVTGGAEGDTYQIDAAGESVVYTRTDTDTDGDVASQLAALLNATGQIESIAADTSLSLVSLILPLNTAISGTGSMDLATDHAPATVNRGLRSGTLSLYGYGNSARPWMERVRSYLYSPAAAQTMIAGGVTVLSAGDIVTEQVDLGTGYEPRYTCALSLSYTLQTVAQLATYAEHILVAGSAASSGGSGLPFQVEVSP